MNKIFSILALFISALVFSQQSWKLKFYNEKTPTGFKIFADNDEPMPMSSTFKFTLTNMVTSLKDNAIVVIPAQSKKVLIAEILAQVPNKSYRFSYENSYNFGDGTITETDKNYIYDLPVEENKNVKIYQGYNGNFSHQNALALDFQMVEGSQVFAAREGKVVDVVESNTRNCTEKDCAKFNNKIIILHSDCTFGEYLHLKQNGAEVNAGDVVKKGQLIGYSGNTGWSSGPHLHFSVFVNKISGERIFFPTKFRTSTKEPELLSEKATYMKNY